MNVKEVKAVTKVMLDFPYNDSPSRSEVQQWAIRLENAVAEQSEAPLSVALDDVVEMVEAFGPLIDEGALESWQHGKNAVRAGDELTVEVTARQMKRAADAYSVLRRFASPEGGDTEDE